MSLDRIKLTEVLLEKDRDFGNEDWLALSIHTGADRLRRSCRIPHNNPRAAARRLRDLVAWYEAEAAKYELEPDA